MGCVQQAVLEFDEEVRAPWRPRLVAALPIDPPVRGLGSTRALPTHSSAHRPTRVGACRPLPPSGRPAAVVRRKRGTGVDEVSGIPTSRAGRGAGPVGARCSRRRLRLTRRARRLALLLAVAAGIALGSWLAPLLGVGDGGGLRLAGVTSVVVQPGDTLWSIASPVAADGDVRAVVAEIRQLNGLSSADLVPGQTLRLP